ncbi:MAG: hypothetical protein ACYDAG_02455 [Chloroflexota bacterium]
MSTGLECVFIEVKPKRWYYILEDYGAPKNAWDWREHATATGPFSSLKAAETYLRDHESNPGGYGVSPYDPECKRDEVITGLVAHARNPHERERAWGPFWQIR